MSIINTYLNQITQLNELVNVATQKVTTTKAEYDRMLAYEAELDRQRLYHIGNNDIYNAGIISQQLHTVRPQRENAGVIWERAKAELKTALDDLAEAKARLSENEKAAITSELKAAEAQAQAQAIISNNKLAQEQTNYAANTTKYVLISIVVVVVVGVFVYFKYRKK